MTDANEATPDPTESTASVGARADTILQPTELQPTELHALRRMENAGWCAWLAVSAWEIARRDSAPDQRSLAGLGIDLAYCTEWARITATDSAFAATRKHVSASPSSAVPNRIIAGTVKAALHVYGPRRAQWCSRKDLPTGVVWTCKEPEFEYGMHLIHGRASIIAEAATRAAVDYPRIDDAGLNWLSTQTAHAMLGVTPEMGYDIARAVLWPTTFRPPLANASLDERVHWYVMHAVVHGVMDLEGVSVGHAERDHHWVVEWKGAAKIDVDEAIVPTPIPTTEP